MPQQESFFHLLWHVLILGTTVSVLVPKRRSRLSRLLYGYHLRLRSTRGPIAEIAIARKYEWLAHFEIVSPL